MTHRRLDALTGLRFFAAFHVLAFHYSPAWPSLLEPLRASGFVAVSMFFVLSGFILAHHYGEAARAGTLRQRAFWAQRWSRIYPAYAVGLVLLLPMALHPAWGARVFGGTSLFGRAATGAAHALLVQAWLPRLVTSWNLPGWSVCVEAFFYLVFPVVAMVIARRLSTKRRLLAAMAALWAVSLSIGAAYVVSDPDGLGGATHESTGFWLSALKFSPLARLPEFLFGVCLGRWFAYEPSRRHAGLRAAAAAAGIVGVLLGSARLPFPLLHGGLLTPLYGMLILALADRGGAIGRILGARPLRVLGEASYALYILQFPVMMWATLALGHAPAFAWFAPLAVALSLVCFYFVERPLQRVLRERLLSRLNRTPSPSALDPLYSGCTESSPAAPPAA